MSSQLTQAITPEWVGKLARVAGINMGPDRLGAMTSRYLGFLEEMERLQELDVNNQEPATVFQAREGK